MGLSRDSKVCLFSFNMFAHLYPDHRPMDFLVTPRHRFVHIIIFGVMAQSLLMTFRTIGTPPGIEFYFGIVYQTCKGMNAVMCQIVLE